MSRFSSLRLPGWPRVADWLLIGLLATTGFLLGCYELGDTDIWWHLRGGQWILEHGRVPRLDPFTFGSEKRAWVDIHWGFEVLMALVFGQGGVPAVILVAAAAGTLALVAGLTARCREWPLATAIVCFVPALLLMSFRFDPRPEIFTLLYLGCFLALLWRIEERPVFAWVLPVVQILWVNTQGLFILGPILVGCFVMEHAVRWLGRNRHGSPAWSPEQRWWWRHVGGAAVAVVAVCFLNPYGVNGARFPFDLYPKVASAGNIYKEYIDELNSPARYVQKATVTVAGRNWYFRCLFFLLNALPLSFAVPALWTAWKSEPPGRKRSERALKSTSDSPRIELWLEGVAAVVGLLVVATLTLASQEMVPWQIAPLGLALAGAAGVIGFYRRHRPAAMVAGAAGLTLAVWMAWLHIFLLGNSGQSESSRSRPDLLMAILGLFSVILVLYWGGSLFRLLVAGAFLFLGLQALQNASRFALVAGTITAWNLGEWTYQLLASRPPGQWRNTWEWSLRLGLAGFLGLWIIALITDRYHDWTGERRHFALREQPLEFAHDAVVFAGRPELPDRALVYDLGQACLYTFHNAPEKKPFMDGRLEMPDQRTFETYIQVEQWLHQQDTRWETAVHDMGDPLILLSHLNNFNGEAVLVSHAGWRCVYFDALAAVFVPGMREDLEEPYPTIDFAARHFRHPDRPSIPDVPGAAFRETRALSNLGSALRRFPNATWKWRIPVLFNALDRASLALAEDPKRAATWTLLGNCHWNLIPDLTTPPPKPEATWDPFTSLPWAQLTFCHRQAVQLAPEDASALRFLYDAYRVRGMADAQLEIGGRLLSHPRVAADLAKVLHVQLQELRRVLGPPVQVKGHIGLNLLPEVVQLSDRRPETAVRLIEEAESRSSLEWTWPLAEAVACTLMHLGRPADARKVWQKATLLPSDIQPSESLLQCRLGDTYLVERDFENAGRCYRAAFAADPKRTEACWGLVMLNIQQGQAAPALRACRQALTLPLTDRTRTELKTLEKLLRPPAP